MFIANLLPGTWYQVSNLDLFHFTTIQQQFWNYAGDWLSLFLQFSSKQCKLKSEIEWKNHDAGSLLHPFQSSLVEPTWDDLIFHNIAVPGTRYQVQ